MKVCDNILEPKIIAFDWDNTLVDTWSVIEEAFNLTLEYFGMDKINLEAIKQNIGGSLRDTFPDMFKERWLEAKDIYLTSFGNIHIERLTKLPWADDIIKEAKEIADYVVVISNKTHDFLEKEIAHLNWNNNFHAYIGANKAKKDKPDPEVLVHLGEEIGFSGDILSLGKKIWYIGDSSTDVEFAKNIGASSFLVDFNLLENKEKIDFGADFVIKNLGDFRAIAKKNCRKS